MSQSQFMRGSHDLNRRRFRGLGVIWLFLGGLLVASPILWITSVHAELLKYGYQVTELRRENQDLVEEQAVLKAELANLKHPERIFRKLGDMKFVLVPLENQYVVEVREQQQELVAKAH